MKELLDFAVHVAEEAGKITLRYFQQSFDVHIKPDQSPVTDADRSAEEYLRREIEKQFPDDGILGEEFGEKESRSGLRWLLDPIDGTKTFIRGVPLYGTLIGLESEGESLLGVVRYPPLAQTLAALCGRGCFLNGERCFVSKTRELSQAAVMMTSFEAVVKDWGPETFFAILKETGFHRTWGDCYAYMLIATGRADICFDTSMHQWDVAPLIPIIQEAGGKITNLDGAISLGVNHAIATNGLLHDVFLQLVRPTAAPRG